MNKFTINRIINFSKVSQRKAGLLEWVRWRSTDSRYRRIALGRMTCNFQFSLLAKTVSRIYKIFLLPCLIVPVQLAQNLDPKLVEHLKRPKAKVRLSSWVNGAIDSMSSDDESLGGSKGGVRQSELLVTSWNGTDMKARKRVNEHYSYSYS